MGYFRCGNGSSIDPKTVDVTFTVEGAKADNITIKDSDGTVVSNVIFGASDTYKEVTLTIPEAGGDYTFTSSVAKATDGISNYSKTVALSSAIERVYLYPRKIDNEEYDTWMWYGNTFGYEYTSFAIYGTQYGVWEKRANSYYVKNNGAAWSGAPSGAYHNGWISTTKLENTSNVQNVKLLGTFTKGNTDSRYYRVFLNRSNVVGNWDNVGFFTGEYPNGTSYSLIGNRVDGYSFSDTEAYMSFGITNAGNVTMDTSAVLYK